MFNMRSQSEEPIDKLAKAIIIVLFLVIGLLVWTGKNCQSNCVFQTGARVNYFSWENQTIGAQDRAFILNFNRPMDRPSVENNLTIDPPLPGKISWSGLRLAYTLDRPPTYGETYQVILQDAQERFPHQVESGQKIQPFQAQFTSRDRALAYIGEEGEEKGRLVLYNWTLRQKSILTPSNLAVFEFKPNATGDLLLFSAADATQGIEGIRYLKLYTVTTGLNQQKQTAGEIKLVLDNQDYQNNKFDLARDGKTIVVQRLERNNPNNYGLWQLQPGKSPQLISDDGVGDFLITPDSQAVAVAQGEGIALLSLKDRGKRLDFLPRFGQVLDFTPDGTGAAVIDYNSDSEKLKYTRSLYYINNQGIEKELLNTDGSIQNCQFDSTAKHLYCWLTELEKGEEYLEKPYLAQIELKTATITTLLALPKYQESPGSIAPDNLGILFVRSPINGSSFSSLANKNKKSIWLYVLPRDVSKKTIGNAEELPFIGFHPQWLP